MEPTHFGQALTVIVAPGFRAGTQSKFAHFMLLAVRLARSRAMNSLRNAPIHLGSDFSKKSGTFSQNRASV